MRHKLSYISLSYFLARSFFIGITFSLLLKGSKQDAWISLLLAILIGLLGIEMIRYIASYQKELCFKEKIVLLFPRFQYLLVPCLTLFLLLLTSLNFWNLANLITSQFLNKTPKFVVEISFFVPILLLLTKNEKVITRVSLILFYISIFLFFFSFIGLFFQFQPDHFKPILQNSILPSTLPFLGFHIFPLFLLLFFPNEEILPHIRKGYLLASFSLFLVTVTIIGVLGVDLALIYQYPEFHILKRAYEGVLSYRLENILTVQWIFDIFIFCSVCLKGCNELCHFEKKKRFLLPFSMILLSTYLFKDNTIANTVLEKYLVYIVPLFFFLLLSLFCIQIFLKKRRNSPTYSISESKR